MPQLIVLMVFITATLCQAGVYSTLEFGDNRETVTKKLKASDMVEQKIQSTFLGRTGLNGVFICKTKIAGLTCSLYFNWDDNGGLNEITLRSEELPLSSYNSSLKKAWGDANNLFTQVYNLPIQNAAYPHQDQFEGHGILITHMWHKGSNQSILIGPAVKKDQCFLIVRFVNKKIEAARLP